MSALKIAVSASDHTQGRDDAPVVLVEYGDYQCPYCGQAAPIVKRLQAALGNDLKLVFRNFPLTEAHPDALNAAKAAEAAAAGGKFWEMHDLLYEHQIDLDTPSLLGYAEELGLDVEAFEQNLGDQRILERIEKDFEGGVRSGVNGTPGFFVNGARYDRDWGYDTFVRVLQEIARNGRARVTP
ncbi:MAG TPA: thioredoxin domain-containing protein [Polyangiaceae bacterium]|jgi:protein-disulfide isomerase|nr:thioredoxin domain-containing protein [Polyangiaceae bacterium]